jgi:hypothetical protein
MIFFLPMRHKWIGRFFIEILTHRRKKFPYSDGDFIFLLTEMRGFWFFTHRDDACLRGDSVIPLRYRRVFI